LTNVNKYRLTFLIKIVNKNDTKFQAMIKQNTSSKIVGTPEQSKPLSIQPTYNQSNSIAYKNYTIRNQQIHHLFLSQLTD
jgi:hypothetical protein